MGKFYVHKFGRAPPPVVNDKPFRGSFYFTQEGGTIFLFEVIATSSPRNGAKLTAGFSAPATPSQAKRKPGWKPVKRLRLEYVGVSLK